MFSLEPEGDVRKEIVYRLSYICTIYLYNYMVYLYLVRFYFDFEEKGHFSEKFKFHFYFTFPPLYYVALLPNFGGCADPSGLECMMMMMIGRSEILSH